MEKEEDFFISKEKLLDHAIVRILLGVVTKTPRLEDWRNITVRPEPLIIYDINGKPLFHEFTVHKDERIIGTVKVSASKVLGPSVYTVEIGPRLWDPEETTKKAMKIAQEKYKNAEIASTQLVCYGYPKLGILVVLIDPETKEEISRMIIDVIGLEIVPDVLVEEDVEGTGIWSMYASIPQRNRHDRILRWEEDDKLVEYLKEETKKAGFDIKTQPSDQDLENIERIFGKVLGKQAFKKKKTNPNIEIAVITLKWFINSETIPLTLNGQETNYYCACATGQMLLRHHHYYYEQDDIATAMGTGTGGTNPNQAPGYVSLSHNYLDAVFDSSPTWVKAKDEIDEGRPLKSGIIGHSRACAGYSSFYLGFSATTRLLGMIPAWRTSLLIYDPSPVSTNNTFCNPQGGKEKWEDWDAVTHTNYIYLRPCMGSMTCQD